MLGIRAKLAVYFVLLGVLPAAAALIGLSALAAHDQTAHTDARLETELRAALAVYTGRLRAAEHAAAATARDPALPRLLRRHDSAGLRRFVAAHPGVAVVVGGATIGRRPAIVRAANLRSGQRLLARVLVAVDVDAPSLRKHAAVGPGDAVAIVAGRRVVAASPPLVGTLSRLPAGPGSVALGTVHYRGVAQPPLVVLAPPPSGSLLDGANRSRLLLVLLALLAIVALASYLEGRAIVAGLGRLAGAANAIAEGQLDRRVEVRGHDEVAELGRAFNEMAAQLEHRIAELAAAIERIGDTLASTHDETQLLQVLADTVREATGANSVVVEADGDRIVSGETNGAAHRELRLDGHGTLTLAGDTFDAEQLAIASSLAAQAVVALDNARLHELVAREASADPLTGLANRRQLERTLARELARSRRLDAPVSLIVADLDDFKRVNDQHGHPAGDAVLRGVAAVLERTLREIDTAGRWGGEEFVAILPGTSREGARHVAERLRAAVAAEPIAGLHVTASFGVADTAADDLFGAADGALYRAKAAGKNRVEI